MKNQIALISIFFLISLMVISCNPNHKHHEVEENTELLSNQIGYDSVAAEQYGADQYGMKKYVFAFLKIGPNRDLDSAKSAELQIAHLENIMKMAEDGKLLIAGPFFGDEDIRGIYIFNVESIEEAQELTNTDPAIQAGSLEMELREWYGTAALVAVYDIHKTLAKKQVSEQ